MIKPPPPGKSRTDTHMQTDKPTRNTTENGDRQTEQTNTLLLLKETTIKKLK